MDSQTVPVISYCSTFFRTRPVRQLSDNSFILLANGCPFLDVPLASFFPQDLIKQSRSLLRAIKRLAPNAPPLFPQINQTRDGDSAVVVAAIKSWLGETARLRVCEFVANGRESIASKVLRRAGQPHCLSDLVKNFTHLFTLLPARRPLWR